jgi:hypothetical protein
MSDKSPTIPTNTELDAFLAKMQGLTHKPTATGGRLILALDATASRQPTWDTACPKPKCSRTWGGGRLRKNWRPVEVDLAGPRKLAILSA